MSNSLIYFVVAVIILNSLPFVVQAQIFCLKRELVIKELKKEFNEVPVSIGVVGERIIEIFASPNGETFTIVFTTQQGLTCPIAAGENWMNLPLPGKEGLNILQQGQPNG